MEEANRMKLDEEIGRLRTKLASLEPETDEYSKVLNALSKHEEVAIQDDRLTNERDLEALKRGFDSEKMEAELGQRKKEFIWDIIKLGITGFVTVGTCLLTLNANKNVQLRAQQFEMNGYDYTSKETKFFNRLPPSPRM